MILSKTSTLHDALSGCSSWEDVQRKWHPLAEKQKGDCFEHLVKAWLQLEPEYATKLKHVWLHREVPQAIAKKLKLPATDQGIDIVAETHDGEFWGIQCKYRHDTDHSLTWREISTFTGLAFGVCRGISFGLICSTTERITHVLKDQEKIGFCALDVWQTLDAEFFKRLRAHLAHKPETLKPLRPRPHQKEAVKDGLKHFVTGKAKRGKLIMPCGSGKSLTAYWLARALDARRIVIAVPSLALIRQTLKVWLRESVASRQAVRWICVCSDESAGRIERNDVAVLRQDIGVPCLTDSNEISTWLKQKHRGLTVVFTTYQSGETLSTAARSAKLRFDLCIMDEAHKTVGATDKLFSHLLHDANLPIRRRVFMTATERRYRGQSDDVLSMDDPDVYGETFHLLSFKQALEYDPPILSDYKILTIFVSRDEVAKLIRQNVFVKPDKGKWDKEIEADMLASLIALRKAMENHPVRHAVSFHSSIQRAGLFKLHNEAFTRAFPEYGNMDTFHVSGRTPTGTRARIIGEFAKSKRGLITNARCLTEGVDVPGIDCVLFADPRRSAVDIVQAVGRALRPAPGKKLGYVIVPILHDADATPDDIFESESFQEVLTTLRALAANDDRIIEYFRGISQGRQRTGGGSVGFDMDEQLAHRIDLALFVQDISLKCWDRLAKLSWRGFEDARAFARELGLKRSTEWMQFYKGNLPEKGTLPNDIPTNPNVIYAGSGWVGYGDWLGTGTLATHLRQYRPFNDARAFIQHLRLRSQIEWARFRRGELTEKGTLPSDIPAAPERVYADEGWAGYGNWLGTGNVAPRLRQYRSFNEARAFAHSLDLKNRSEWAQFCKGKLPEKGSLPQDIPMAPDHGYVSKGWESWGDWLGTGNVAPCLRQYRSFNEARAFARSLDLKNRSEWAQFCKGRLPEKGSLPQDIPASPEITYKSKGWAGVGDWLGTGIVATHLRRFCPFKEARTIVRDLGLKNISEWRAFCKGSMPERGILQRDIPANPVSVYFKVGWAGWGDWLGSGTVASRLRKFRPFDQARAFVRGLGLKNGSEWKKFCKGELLEKGILPSDIPSNPNLPYASKGWLGWGDWLGTGNVAPRLRQFRPFKEARAFARSLDLKNGDEWALFCKGGLPEKGLLPQDIPASPERTYKSKGWAGVGDWLGTGIVATHLRRFCPFKEARGFTRGLGLKSNSEWRRFCEGKMQEKGTRPKNIPAYPDDTYANTGWTSWGDWLGTWTVAPRLRHYRSFKEARAFARGLGLKTWVEWIKFCKGDMPEKGILPSDLPNKPDHVYAKQGWAGVGDWLGTGFIAPRLREYRSFTTARTFARSLGLKSRGEWKQFCQGDLPEKGKLPPDISTSPHKTYANKGWAGMRDWLGTGKL